MAYKNFDKFISTKPEYTREALPKQVSLKYHLIIEMFMKSNANVVAEYQKKWDHKIHLEKSKKTPFVRNYKSLLDQKTAAIKKYINEHLKKSFIWPSFSAAVLPILLVRKLNRGLQFCINYWALNAVTVKN